jgi:HK97 family phage portal protein
MPRYGMGLFQRLFGKAEKRGIPLSQVTSQSAFELGLTDSPTRSGVTVSEQTALGISALWAGIRTISQDVGSLEPVLYRESSQGREVAEDHPVYALLTETPNPDMTRPVLFETLQAHALIHGGAFAEIERNGAGTPTALWPIHPRNVVILRDGSGNLVYRVTVTINNLNDQHQLGEQVDLAPEDILHVPGLSPDGTVGYRLLSIARETLGFAIATQRYGSSFYGNAARPGGILSTAGQLNDTARENLRRSWQLLHQGTENVGKVAILEEGIEFKPFVMTNEQSQYKDLLNWLVYEVARFLLIPPTKLMSLEGASQYAVLEQLSTEYLTVTLRPWLEKWEAEFERKLLTPTERRNHYIEYDTVPLLRADATTRANFYQSAIQNGWMTVDEIRARENLPPLRTK